MFGIPTTGILDAHCTLINAPHARVMALMIIIMVMIIIMIMIYDV